MTDYLSELHAKYMVPQQGLIDVAVETVLRNREIENTEQLKLAFDQVLVEIEAEVYRLYKISEAELVEKQLAQVGDRALVGPGPFSREEVQKALGTVAADFGRLFMSLGQSRRSKAGKTFEIILKTLFKRLKYPFDEQRVINGKPDFLLPSERVFRLNPNECIILTAKRTLRERWRQITSEGKHFRLFLATIDTKLSEAQLEEMLRQNVYLVVPQGVIDQKPSYKAADNVIPFSEFFRDFLDPSLQRWRDKNWV